MFDVQMHDFSYDRQFLQSEEGRPLLEKVVIIYNKLKDDFVIDFECLSEENRSTLQDIRNILHSSDNKDSTILNHLIHYFNLNVRRSNKVEENNMLHMICACGRLEDVIWYLNTFPKVKVNTLNHIHQTPLQFAIALGNSPEIAMYLYTQKGARLYPEGSTELFDEDGDYTVVDALFIQWMQGTNSFYSNWEKFGDLICEDIPLADLLKKRLPELHSYLRSDMVFK